MPNPYLYAVIALVVALVVVGAYLGMMVNSEVVRVAALQSQLSALKANYTMLESQYTQLQSQYTTLQSQYEQLKTNYTAIMNTISLYKSIITPVAYVYEGQGVNALVLYLNITNPTSNTINMTLNTYAGPPISGEVLRQLYVMVPSGATLELPVMLVMYNSTYMFYMSFLGFGGGGTGTFTTGMFERMNLTITILASELTNIGIPGIAYGTTIVKVVHVNQPIGYAEYQPTAPGFYLELLNPLLIGVTINGYELYSYNGTLLTACTLEQPITINATSMTWFGFQTESQPYYVDFSWYTLRQGWQYGSTTVQVTCSLNYLFPISTAQLPFGYVVLNTSVGNVTIPLVPPP